MLSPISDHTKPCCYCWLHPYRVSYSFVRGLGNIAQENITVDILVEYQLWPSLVKVTVDQEQELHKPNSWTKLTVNRSWTWQCIPLPPFFLLHWIKKLSSHRQTFIGTFVVFWYQNYDERTICTPVMMRGPIVHQLWWEDHLYTSYDERTICTPVMMRGPFVRQLWWEDHLYASYDERTYCMPVMMRGPFVHQL